MGKIGTRIKHPPERYDDTQISVLVFSQSLLKRLYDRVINIVGDNEVQFLGSALYFRSARINFLIPVIIVAPEQETLPNKVNFSFSDAYKTFERYSKSVLRKTEEIIKKLKPIFPQSDFILMQNSITIHRHPYASDFSSVDKSKREVSVIYRFFKAENILSFDAVIYSSYSTFRFCDVEARWHNYDNFNDNKGEIVQTPAYVLILRDLEFSYDETVDESSYLISVSPWKTRKGKPKVSDILNRFNFYPFRLPPYRSIVKLCFALLSDSDMLNPILVIRKSKIKVKKAKKKKR